MKNRNTIETMVIMFTGVVCFMLIAISVTIVIVEISDPETDTTNITQSLISLLSGILGALLGLLAGKPLSQGSNGQIRRGNLMTSDNPRTIGGWIPMSQQFLDSVRQTGMVFLALGGDDDDVNAKTLHGEVTQIRSDHSYGTMVSPQRILATIGTPDGEFDIELQSNDLNEIQPLLGARVEITVVFNRS